MSRVTVSFKAAPGTVKGIFQAGCPILEVAQAEVFEPSYRTAGCFDVQTFEA